MTRTTASSKKAISIAPHEDTPEDYNIYVDAGRSPSAVTGHRPGFFVPQRQYAIQNVAWNKNPRPAYN